MHLYFARHGETDWNVKKWIQGTTDIELNQEGLNQAHALANTLEGLSISYIFTSKLMRASKTAQIVADALKIPYIETDGLQEICFGEWEGHTWYDVKCGWEELYEHW